MIVDYYDKAAQELKRVGGLALRSFFRFKLYIVPFCKACRTEQFGFNEINEYLCKQKVRKWYIKTKKHMKEKITKENLKDWLDNRIDQTMRELGLTKMTMPSPSQRTRETIPVRGEITFLKGESTKKVGESFQNKKEKSAQSACDTSRVHL